MKAEHLSLSFGARPIYQDCGFILEPRDKVGIVGVNGAGKSTLFKVILGIEKLDEGTIELPALRIGFLPQEIKIDKIHDNTTVWDYIAAARPVDELQAKIGEEYEKLAGDYGFTIEKKGINTSADISLATEDLLGKVDCLTNLTDNTVVSSLATILDMANEKNIPVFGSEIEQVKIGCLAAEGIDYINLGIQTGKMAAKVLKGEESAADMPFESLTDNSLYVNEAVAANLGITVPDTMKERAVETFTEISEE